MQITRHTIMAILCGVSFMLSLSQEAKAAFSPVQHGSACNHGGKEVVIYYINGVFTDSVAAFVNRSKLVDFSIASELPPTFPENEVCFIFDNLENPTADLYDVLETFHQLDQLDPKESWLTLGDVLTLASPLGSAKLKLLERLAVATTDSSLIDATAIQGHATKIAGDIRDLCRSIILVPHSQGNLYARMAVNLILQDPSLSAGLAAKAIRVVGIASPDVVENAPTSYGGIYSWMTNHGDILMGNNVPLLFPFTGSIDGLVRQLHPKLYKANTAWTTGPTDWLSNSLGHGFAGYLQFQPSQDNIRTTMIEALVSLPLGSCGFQFALPSYTVGGPGVAHITVLRNGGSAKEEEVSVETGDGTATAGTDYVALPKSQLRFLVGETFKQIDVTLLRATNNLQFLVYIIDPISGAHLPGRNTAVTIVPTSDWPGSVHATYNGYQGKSNSFVEFPRPGESRTTVTEVDSTKDYVEPWFSFYVKGSITQTYVGPGHYTGEFSAILKQTIPAIDPPSLLRPYMLSAGARGEFDTPVSISYSITNPLTGNPSDRPASIIVPFTITNDPMCTPRGSISYSIYMRSASFFDNLWQWDACKTVQPGNQVLEARLSLPTAGRDNGYGVMVGSMDVQLHFSVGMGVSILADTVHGSDLRGNMTFNFDWKNIRVDPPGPTNTVTVKILN